jgi:predicted AlkP superfamily phosphohydrolase/phosphomutase
MSEGGPVILLGMDATEITLVEAMLADGELPHLAALRERGLHGEVRTRPEGFLSMVWPTFFTGQALGAHGWYFNKLWNAERQRLQYASHEWSPLDPFYRHLDPSYRIALLDIPFMTAPRNGFDGAFLNGWQAHDDFGQATIPPSLWRELRQRFGAPAMKPELFGAQTVETLLAQRKEGLESLEQFGEVCRHLLRQERWDLLVAVFGGAHRATHYLWSLEEVDTTGADSETLRLLRDAPRALYRAWDEALGRLVADAPADARILVFGLHGMGPNKGWAEHFAAMVSHIHGRGRVEAPKQGLVYRLKKALPWTLVRQVTRRLPSSVNHALVPLWSRRMLDWSSTRFFPLPLDLNGYLRINLRGREAEGIVEPGPEYEALLDALVEDFMSLRDLATDRPIVRAVDRVVDLVGADAPSRDMLPDLIVRWADVRAYGSPGVRSRYGEIRWDASTRLPSGRSGNHTPRGWYAAAGPGIPVGSDAEVRDTVDLMPTVFRWLGAEPAPTFEGEPIPVLVGDAPARAPAGG